MYNIYNEKRESNLFVFDGNEHDLKQGFLVKELSFWLIRDLSMKIMRFLPPLQILITRSAASTHLLNVLEVAPIAKVRREI